MDWILFSANSYYIYKVSSTVIRLPLDTNQLNAFDTLDDYSLLGILEWVKSFGNLATIASMSPRIRQLALDYDLVSQYKIRNATLRIQIDGARNYVQAIKYRPSDEKRFRELCSTHDHFFATLQAFCPAFGLLDITVYHLKDSDIAKKAIDYINRYCSTVP